MMGGYTTVIRGDFSECRWNAQANAEKLRLETKQRAARKAAERGDPIKPRWFTRVEGAEPGRQQAYVYHGGYFEAREAGHWPGVRDIFGLDPPASPTSPHAH
jgi:hypothetical protein